MLAHYIIREVQPGAVCSYRVGQTYVDEQYYDEDKAQRRCDTYNRFCSVAGVRYFALPHRDDECLPVDFFEPRQLTCEQIIIAD